MIPKRKRLAVALRREAIAEADLALASGKGGQARPWNPYYDERSRHNLIQASLFEDDADDPSF